MGNTVVPANNLFNVGVSVTGGRWCLKNERDTHGDGSVKAKEADKPLSNQNRRSHNATATGVDAKGDRFTHVATT